MADVSFTDQVALVTGGGSGIGRATALLLGQRGARVVVNDPAPGRAETVAREIETVGGIAAPETTPVGTHNSARRIIDAAMSAFGRIDLLHNNAGIACPGPFGTQSDEDVDRILAVDLLGPFALTRAVWPMMQAQGYGRIVNMCSSAALGSGISGPYAVAKAGLIGLTKEAAIAGQPHHVLVNAVMPAAATPLLDNHPDPAFRDWMKKTMPAECVAAVVAYLLSSQNSETGEVFAVAGGYVSRIAFLEGRGYLDHALSPEAVRDNMGAIRDLTNPSVLATQMDHEKILSALFPRTNDP